MPANNLKKFIVTLLLLPVVLSALVGLTILIVLQQGVTSKSDLAFLVSLGQRYGPGNARALAHLRSVGAFPTAIRRLFPFCHRLF
jgi:hypothetical protein